MGLALLMAKHDSAREDEMEMLRKRLVELENQSDETVRAVSRARYLAGVAGRDAEVTAAELKRLGRREGRDDAALGDKQESEDELAELSPDEGKSAFDDGYDFEAQARFFEDYFDELEQERRAAGDDQEWEAQVRASAEEALAGEMLAGNSLEELDCGVSLCRVKVTHENEEARSTFSMIFAGSLRGHVGGGTFHGPHGAKQTIAYLARKGHDLPAPTRRPGE